jgi:hypothetical protein
MQSLLTRKSPRYYNKWVSYRLLGSQKYFVYWYILYKFTVCCSYEIWLNISWWIFGRIFVLSSTAQSTSVTFDILMQSLLVFVAVQFCSLLPKFGRDLLSRPPTQKNQPQFVFMSQKTLASKYYCLSANVQCWNSIDSIHHLEAQIKTLWILYVHCNCVIVLLWELKHNRMT